MASAPGSARARCTRGFSSPGVFDPAPACVFSELNIGKKLNEGKTKQIFEIVDQPGLVLVQSKDQITAWNAVRKDQMEGKAAMANRTTSCVFQLLQESGQ